MFSKKPEEFPASSAPAPKAKPMGGNSTFSVIGTDVTIKGDVSASVDLHVDGRIEGDIACSNLVQGEGSEIHGAIEAESARLAGHVKGSISSRELIILKSAKIEGDVHYDTLTIEQGANVEGHFGARKAKAAAPAQKPVDGRMEPKKADTGAPKTGGDEPALSLAG